MKNYEVTWRPQARGDLLALYEWIADQADPDTAYEYVSKIEAHAAALSTYPERGTARDDLAPVIRTIPYRRRTVIAYRVLDDIVEILDCRNSCHRQCKARLGRDFQLKADFARTKH